MTKIEWVINPDGTQGDSWNPITGCLHNCSYCYAKIISKRYGDDFTPKYHPERYDQKLTKKPITVFVGSMGDMFGDWVDPLERLKIHYSPNNTYLYLTKNPKGYYSVSDEYGYPNRWFGITLEDLGYVIKTLKRAEQFIKVIAKAHLENTFISFEPLLMGFQYDYYKRQFLDSRIYGLLNQVKWIIVGALTKNGKPDSTVDFKEVIDFLRPWKDKLFVKDSIYELYPDMPKFRALPYLKGKYEKDN